MKKFRQWINYILVPRENGKTDKIPTDPRTGRACNAHNPEIWVSYEEAVQRGNPAFVFTTDDPFFFLDIDDCLGDDGQWNNTALYLCHIFAGCKIEVSQSGRGLHVFGIPPWQLPHGCDSKLLNSQFYTERRFCAVTETGVIGDALHVPDEQVYSNFIRDYFPPTAAPETATPDTWTTAPRAEWLGPDDDTRLIERAMRSRSKKNIVGAASLTFKQLWNADPDTLSAAFPGVGGGADRTFDWSQADSALCSHLAFWTGGDCERIDRLWGLSVLGQRNKYHDRPDYRQRTILNAVKICSNVYRDKSMVPASDESVEQPVAAEPVSEIRNGFQFLTPEDQQKLFAGCAYVRDIHRCWVPDGGLLKPEQFRAMYGGYVFALDSINDKTTKNAWDAFTESQAFKTRWVHGTCFQPEHPAGAIITSEGRSLINTYVPIETERTTGDPAPFLDLLSRLLPEQTDRDILLAYMAACTQYPGVKFQWAPVIQGTFGNGKSLLTDILSRCVGQRYTHKVNAQDIDNVFNSWITGKLLIVIDEIKTTGSAIETLKWLITDSRVPIQAKGQDQTTGDNRANIIMCTNYKDGVVKKRDDRRFSVFFTAQQTAEDLKRDEMSGYYFPNLITWLKTGGYAIVNNYLREYAIPEALNPAGMCVWAPETSSNEQAVRESFSPIAQEVIEAVSADTPGFSGGWISSMALNRLIGTLHSRITINQRKEILRELGYTKHPALTGGRATRMITNEGGRPRLYIKNSHISANINDSAQATAAYCAAQGYPELTDTLASPPRSTVTVM